MLIGHRSVRYNKSSAKEKGKHAQSLTKVNVWNPRSDHEESTWKKVLQPCCSLVNEDQDQTLGSLVIEAKIVQLVLVGNQASKQEYRENGLFVSMKVLGFQNYSCYFPQSSWTINLLPTPSNQSLVSGLVSGSKELRNWKRTKWKLKSSTTFENPTLVLQWSSLPWRISLREE